MIPYHIFQTHKSAAYVNTKPKLVNATNSWRSHKQFKYLFFTDAMCDAFMRDHFAGPVYEAYQRLPMAVMKADLWRYCILYTYGGIYADVDTVCHVNPSKLLRHDKQLCCAPEPGCPYFCQWIFAAHAGAPILKSVIELSVERILSTTDFKGPHLVHHLTGPAVFTDGIEYYLRTNGIPTYKQKNSYRTNKVMAIYEVPRFHIHVVIHLYAGSDKDGWKEEKRTVLA